MAHESTEKVKKTGNNCTLTQH